MYDENWNNHDMVYSTLGIPKEAVEILGYCAKIPIDDFKDPITGRFLKNSGRTVDPKDSEIAKWTTFHEKGIYNDKIHCPPTFKSVMNNKALVTGFGKTKGADGADNVNEIGGVEVRFKDHDDISAAEWEEIARSNENRDAKDRPDFISNPRVQPDIIGTLKSIYEKGNMKLSKKGKNGEDVEFNGDLNKRLEKLHLPKNQWPKWRAEFYTNIGVNTNLIVRFISKNKKEDEKFQKKVANLYPGKKIYFKELVSGTSHSNTKYGIELSREILDARLKGEPYDIVVFKISGVGTQNTLSKNRETNRNFFTDKNSTFQQDLKRSESKIKDDEKWPEVLFEPQTEQEIIQWETKGDKLW